MTLCRPFSFKLTSFLSSSSSIKSLNFPNSSSQSIHSAKTHFPIFPNSTLHSVISQNDASAKKCQTSDNTRELFDRITDREQFHSNCHLSILTRSQRGEGTVESLHHHSAVSCIVRAICNTGSDNLNRGIHAAVVKIGFEQVVSIATSLIGFYSSFDELESARRLFYSIPTKDLILWSAMVSAFCKNGQFIEAIGTFREMQCYGFSPNSVSLLSVLSVCANARALLYGKQIHGYVIRRGFDSETSIQNSLIDLYLKCGKLDAALLVFDGINEKDGISWKNIIFGFVENGQPRKALLMFSSMRAFHIKPDEIILRNVIGGCSQLGDFMYGLGLHCYVIKNGYSGSISIGTSLLRMYAEFKKVETAQTLFNQLSYKDQIAWSAMVSVYSHTGHPNLALEVFKQMQLAKKEANEVTLVSLLQACSLMEAQELGRSIHAHVTRLGYNSNKYMNSSLIDFYCKIGRLRQGEVLFDKIQSRDLVCWSSMINGYGINGCGEEAIQTFSSMLENGLVPNRVVFVSLLSACSHCGLFDEGWKWFYSMEEKFGISPTLEHHTCIVDLLGRRGKVKEALDFIKRMPSEPDASVWGVLLSWCRGMHGDIEVAETVAEKLIRLDPNNTSYYVTLSNMYAKLGRWGDAKRIRGLMEDKGLRKTAGYSMV